MAGLALEDGLAFVIATFESEGGQGGDFTSRRMDHIVVEGFESKVAQALLRLVGLISDLLRLAAEAADWRSRENSPTNQETWLPE